MAVPETDGATVLDGAVPAVETSPDTLENEKPLVPDAFDAATPTRT